MLYKQNCPVLYLIIILLLDFPTPSLTPTGPAVSDETQLIVIPDMAPFYLQILEFELNEVFKSKVLHK